MKIDLKSLTALVSLSLLSLVSARAVTLTINDGSVGGVYGAIGSVVGTIDPGTPSDLDHEVEFVNHLLGMTGTWQTDANVPVSAPPPNKTVTIANRGYDFDGSVSAADSFGYATNPPVDGPAGYEYVLAKLGNTDYVWYLGGEAFNLGSNFGSGNGLSHWVAFNTTTTNVPDGGTTAVLLGLGLVGLSFIARRKVA